MICYQKKQSGAILVTALIFLTVLTLVGVTTLKGTALEYQVTMNNVFQTRAFFSSESARTAFTEVLDDHVYYRNWSDVTLPVGLSLIDSEKDLFVENDSGEAPTMNSGILSTDATMRINGDGRPGYASGGDIKGDVSVYKTRVAIANGSGAAMVSGYMGLGKSSANGGAAIFFEVRSTGESALGATAITGSEYRALVVN